MGISFTKKLPTGQPAQSQASAAAAPKKTGGVTFLMKGAAAKAAVQQEEVKAEARRAAFGPAASRSRYRTTATSKITFLDGSLDADGMLDIPRFYQHTIQVGSGWESFVCTAEIDTSQPCPLCEGGDKPSLVGVMTVIDHSVFVQDKGPNAGKVYKNQRRLFVAKEGTLKSLNKLAAKPERNGLALCTFDVSRGPENKHSPERRRHVRLRLQAQVARSNRGEVRNQARGLRARHL